MEAVTKIKNWIGDEIEVMVNDNPKSVIEGNNIAIDFEYESEKQSNIFSRIKNRIGLI